MNQTRYRLMRLRAWREYQLLTQGKLAQAAGVGKSTVIRLESGKNEANGITVEKLARGLGITREQLLHQQPEV